MEHRLDLLACDSLATANARLPRTAWGALGALVLMAGCGRVGVELLGGDERARDPITGVAADAGPADGAVPVGEDVSDASMGDAAVDAEHAGGDASVDVDAGSDASEPETLADAGPQPCDFSGTWVAKLTVATSWPSGVALSSGSGTSEVWAKFQLTPTGALVPGSMAACGVSLPDFSLQPALGFERYAVDFNIPLFDAVPPRTVATDAEIRVEGEGFPGDVISMSEAALVLGTTLADPLNDPWPAAGDLINNDMDGDGKRGVTLAHVNDAAHVYMRVDPLGTVRSDRGYYAARVVFSARGTVLSCDEIQGQAMVPRVDTHLVGCSLVGGGECSTLQRDTLDGLRPLFSLDDATYRAIKVGDHATCQTARSALP